MLTAAEREAALETVGAFISSVHAHIESRARGGEPGPDREGSDPRVREFLEQQFGPGYEKLPRAAYASATRSGANPAAPRNTQEFSSTEKPQTFTSEDIAKDLPADVRSLFLQLPEEIRTFLITLDSHYRQPYSSMTADDQAFFRSIKTAERNAFIAMSNDERAFFRALDPANRPFYLTLGAGFRALLRNLPAEEREKRFATAREEIAANAAKPAMDSAREVAALILGKQSTPELRQAAQRVVVNFLNEHPGDLRTAFLGSLSALLQSNDNFVDLLLRDVGTQLLQLQSESAGVDLSGHLMKSRHWLQALALQLCHPEITRDELVANLALAVATSAKFTAKYMPQKSAAPAMNLQLRRPIIG